MVRIFYFDITIFLNFALHLNVLVELMPHIKCYLMSGDIQGDITLLQRMCSYLVFYDIPHKADHQTICKFI